MIPTVCSSGVTVSVRNRQAVLFEVDYLCATKLENY